MSEQQNGQKLSQKLADFAVNFTLNSAPAKAMDNAKLAILDCLGVAVLATAQEIGVNLLKFAEANASPGPCTVWGSNRSVSVRDAAFINGTLAHGFNSFGHWRKRFCRRASCKDASGSGLSPDSLLRATVQ